MKKRKITTRTLNTGKLERTITLKRSEVDEEARTVPIAFSSEEPVERFWGTEILGHDADNVRLGRLNDGAPLLVDHDPRDHVGRLADVSIGPDKVGRTIARFGRSARAEEIFQDVLDEIRTHVSVSYRIHKMEEDLDKNEFRAVDWEPFEVSFVSVPADHTVGVMRSRDDTEKFETIILTEDRSMKIYDKDGNEVDEDGKIIKARAKPAPAPAVDADAELTKIRKDESTRTAEIRALGTEHDCQEITDKAVADGTPLEDVRVLVLANNKESKPLPAPQNLDLSVGDVKRYSLFKAIRAQQSGDWKNAGFELECSDAIAELCGKEARGIYLPCEVQDKAIKNQQRVMTVETVTAGGYLVGTEPQSMIEYLYANTVMGQVGATYLTGLQGDVPIPKMTGAATMYWLSEDEDGTDSQPTLGQVLLMPKTVSGAVPMSRKLIKQSNPSVEALVMNDLNRGIALALDDVALSGDGANGEPLGILNATGISTSTIASAGSPTWPETVEFESDIDTSNALMGSLSWVTTPAVKGNMKTTVKESGQATYIMDNDGEVNGYKVRTTSQLAANSILFGDFASVIIGLWGSLDVVVDTSTKVASGGIVLRVFQDADVGLRHVESFCKNA